jgi:hypothetical protein
MRVLAMLPLLLTLASGGTAGVDQETVESQAAETTDRFEIATHDFVKDGVEHEVFIKLDHTTGQAWKMDGSVETRWKPIPEKENERPAVGGGARYELYCHDFTTNGSEQEVYLRFDRQTGKTWVWSGTEPAWKAVEQDQ